MDTDTTRFVCVADAHRARLLGGRPTRRGAWELTERGALAEAWQEKEHGRPQALSKPTGYTYPGRGHEEEERLRRFARELIAWLRTEHGPELEAGLTLIAAPRLVGALRPLLTGDLAGRIALQEGDLAGQPEAALRRHPRVLEALGED